MQPKISKTLEGIIARSAFNTTKAGMTHSLKDFLTLELLREEGSLAYQLLSTRLKDWELYQVRLRIEREVLGAGRRERTGAEEFSDTGELQQHQFSRPLRRQKLTNGSRHIRMPPIHSQLTSGLELRRHTARFCWSTAIRVA